MKKKEVNDKPGMLDAVKWGLAFVLLGGGIYANNFYAAQPIALRLIGWLVLVCIMALIMSQTMHGRRGISFLRDAHIELRKVVWPTRQETVRTTMLVIAVVLVTGLLLWGVDSILLMLIGLLTGQRG